MTASGTLKHQILAGLAPVTLGGAVLFAEQEGQPLGEAEGALLRASFAHHLPLLEGYLGRPSTHVFVPLSAPEEGHHVAFQGPCRYSDLEPFFRMAPNALTVVDGRPYGYLRFRLIRLEGDSLTRLAEIEVSLAHDTPSLGFELVWAPSEFEPLRMIRFVQRQSEATVHQVARLVAEWGAKFQLLKRYPELHRSLASASASTSPSIP